MTDTVEIETGNGAPTGSVIWLHGLGADGHDFEPIVPELHLDAELTLRFVFPHAPVRPVTINGGIEMRAWYDIVSLDRNGPVDAAGIGNSTQVLEALIERELERGIELEQIVVAGFSQGGAIALNAALRSTGRMAGLMALSTYLPLQDVFSDAATRLPVFMAHGQFDPVLPIELGRGAKSLLEANGYAVEWHDYPMAHGVCPDEILDIRKWLLSVFRRGE